MQIAEGDEGSNGGRGEVGGKEVRVQANVVMAVVVARRMSQEVTARRGRRRVVGVGGVEGGVQSLFEV